MRGIIKDGVYLKTEREATKLRMSGGCWTINLAECDLENITRVVYRTDKGTYGISAALALEKGFNVPNSLGERKWAIPIKHWEFHPWNSSKAEA